MTVSLRIPSPQISGICRGCATAGLLANVSSDNTAGPARGEGVMAAAVHAYVCTCIQDVSDSVRAGGHALVVIAIIIGGD